MYLIVITYLNSGNERLFCRVFLFSVSAKYFPAADNCIFIALEFTVSTAC